MWESPIYRFNTNIDGEKQEILIDVTGSAPNFTEPGKQLEGSLNVFLKDTKPNNTVILDFGAAKLRNTLYLLSRGYTVYACEFNDLYQRSQQAFNHKTLALKHNNFHPLIFPKEFIKFEDNQFDFILLINVLNIMPIPTERLKVLEICRQKIKENGYLFWYTQHGKMDLSKSVAQLFDGYVTGQGRKYHMFYRDFLRNEIHDMLISTGFSHDPDYKFPMSGSSNQAYAFKADGPILLEKELFKTSEIAKFKKTNYEEIERMVRWEKVDDGKTTEKKVYKSHSPKKIIKAKSIDFLDQYKNTLKTIITGKIQALEYQELIFQILKKIFEGKLRKPVLEDTSFAPHQRIDITFTNTRENGFFKELDQGYHIQCPKIYIECKNYSEDIGNPAFEQISGRFGKRKGMFGIIICRKIKNLKKSYERSKMYAASKEEYILLFTDNDINKLINFKLKKLDDKIDDYLDDKLKKLL